MIAARSAGAGWLGWLARPMDIIYMNQPVILLSHINESIMIRVSQPNVLISTDVRASMSSGVYSLRPGKKT